MNIIILIIIIIFLIQIHYINSTNNNTCNPRNKDIIPLNNGILNLTNANNYGNYLPSCSEVINVYTQGNAGNGTIRWPRINCPHLQDGLTNFEDIFPIIVNENDITITDGMKLLLSNCSIFNSSVIIRRLIIKSGGILIFNDNDIVLNVREIHIEEEGKLIIGLETCRLYSTITINFHGSSASSSNILFDNLPSKGIESLGVLEMHGKEYFPTWTKLSRNVVSGKDIIFLQDITNWEVGQDILVTTSAYFDCPSQFQATYCSNKPHQNEIRTIIGISIVDGEMGLQLNSGLTYAHYSSSEYQVEVALLSRRINLKGIMTVSDSYGGHVLIGSSYGEGRISGNIFKQT
jgi:hypothetical protein